MNCLIMPIRSSGRGGGREKRKKERKKRRKEELNGKVESWDLLESFVHVFLAIVKNEITKRGTIVIKRHFP